MKNKLGTGELRVEVADAARVLHERRGDLAERAGVEALRDEARDEVRDGRARTTRTTWRFSGVHVWSTTHGSGETTLICGRIPPIASRKRRNASASAPVS